ncbi:MAG TPA: alanine/ornithine racemase family PLP-dependent enzyme [Candidatus Copromorpha excrementigallinarum]|uniref:Alanine/ornithine racemase family PLP-dependent enzyme n=1 Tax=Candidatus Allocopromorpha excrementigallinarum TaxID=2840742 RepID=A0A9D1I165_9FIRM|nr:alanine/ornithine racemase family PLP-dependent enzyme [Candidatus Copromorpha excrementigallinarum]
MMTVSGRYPKLIIDLKKLRHNVEKVREMCLDRGIELAGVVKGCTGLAECAGEFEKAGCRFIASSRIEQLEHLKEAGIKTPLMMIRTPMISEAEEVVKVAELSLNSEVETLRSLDRYAGKLGKRHKVILMADLGDLREGFWDTGELEKAALTVEGDLCNLELAGIGTNLGCYGAIAATEEKLAELVETAEKIEKALGRRLEFISGGATSALPRVIEGNIPDRINLLRIGEGILLARDLQELWGYDMSFMHRDVFSLQAEVIEVKDKPTYPVGEIMFDAFGNKPVYEDRGIRKRALLALGKVDYAFPEELVPRQKGIKVLGASSDHTILDVEEMETPPSVGDILEFDLRYATIVYLTNSESIEKVYIRK